MIKIHELYIKRVKGEKPEKVDCLTLLKGLGVEGDIHANGGSRQLSLLFAETCDEIVAMNSKEACLSKFTCNIILDGKLSDIKPGSQLDFGGAAITINSIGRDCHEVCPLGTCPLVGGAIFAAVTKSGDVKIGDEAAI